MAGDDMQKELEQLRAEVAALSTAQASKKAAETQVENNPNVSSPSEAEEVSQIISNARAAVEDDEELKGQFDHLINQLEHEIKDLPAITTLAVFSLGVLFGRLLR